MEIADKLFTTLATKAADLDLPGRQIILSDSVGFISNLPDTLLKAFNTTLMEIGDADVLLLVIDASDTLEEMQRKLDACLDTFNNVGANTIPIIAVLNKIDLVDPATLQDHIEILSDISVEVVPISAMNMTNLDELIAALERALPQLILCSITLSYGDAGMSTISLLHEEAIIESESYNEHNIVITAQLNYDLFQKLTRELQPGSVAKISPS